MFKLVIQDDEGKTTVVPLIRDEITIGRKEGNTIRLTERNVSRRHARILRNNGEVHIEDLGSYNGIRVNNARIAERVALRVSDQVQIGDYKLYLKAEGLEQVDESRTMPHERMDSQVPTEAMSSVGPAVTAPQQIPAIQPLPPAQMIGNPARTLVAIGDTDPAGRAIGPVTAEAVAAMSAAGASGAYGRLVVLSSNFAGREFELSRPQMIVGRTDDNDLVVNHRSISRNHAKLVREPDTGRYTISDLQSSNGVRVNGQDYGKVELRRGDVVDLGHVRLRFVEPGEDFVFARDAVITDVPESGGRRGLVFAILAAVVVLGASVAIYATLHNADKPQGDVVVPAGSGSNSGLTLDAGEAIATNDHPSAIGSNQPPIEAPADAAAAATGVRSDDDKSQKAGRCMELQAAKDWQGLSDCAKALDNLGGKDKAKDFTDMALREQRNELKANAAKQALRDHNLKEAQAQLAEIGESSVYFKSLSEVFNKAEAAAIDAAVRKAQAYATAHDCVGLRTQYKQLAASSTAHVAAAIGPVKCVERNALPDNPIKSPVAVGSGSAPPPLPVPPTPPKGPCDSINVDDTMAQAQNQYGAGYAKAALSLMVKALGCRQDIRMYRIAALYACAAHDVTTAKMYYKKLEPSMQGAIVQRCQQENLDVRLP